MTPDQIRDYETPGVFKNVDRTPDRFTRHTVDIDRAPASPERSSGAIWAWVAMGALVALYVLWRCWK